MYDRILVSTEQLKNTVTVLAEQINETYRNDDNLIAIVILEGAKYFAQDLLSEINVPVKLEYLKASSYYGSTCSTGDVKLEGPDELKAAIRGKQLLIIDDIYDTGLTLTRVLNWCKECKAESIKTCVLLEKEIHHQKQINIDFLGLKIEEAFVIGYGLDFEGRYRELPFVAVLKE